MEDHPDSALALLENLSSPQDLPEADRARYALLTAIATDKNKLSLLPCDSLLNFALDYYDEDEKEMAIALLYKGRLQAEMKDTKTAIETTLEALEVLEEYPEDVQYRRLIYSALGLWYGKTELYHKALEELNHSLRYIFTPKDSSIAYANIGFVYLMRGQKDSAINFQQRALDYALIAEDSDLIITSWYDMSVFYDHFEEIDSAMVYAKKVIQNVSSSSEDYGNYCYHLGDLYLDYNEYDSARYYLNKSIELQGEKSISYYPLASLEADLGNFEKAYQYLDNYVLMIDSMFYSREVTEVQHLVYKHQTEMSVKDEQMKARRRAGMLVSIFIVLCFTVVVIYQNRINRKNKIQELYQQSLEYANDKLHVMQQRIEENESVITLLQKEQNANSEEIAKREELIEQLKDEKFKLRTWLFEQTLIYKKVKLLSEQKVSDKKKREILTTVELEKLKKTTFEIYADYISPLQANYPRLTEDDLLFLCLQQAGFPPLTIAMCFGYSDTMAINQRKSRLKAKMS
ncbi:hypothetical protein [Phocaeicola sp.]